MHQTDSERMWAVFEAAVNAAGGPGRMVMERRLGWLPHLMESACVVVLQEVQHRSLEDIAEYLGITRDVVESVLTGPEDAAERLSQPPPSELPACEHLAGGAAKRAWRGLPAEH